MKEKSAFAKSPQEENYSIQGYLQFWSLQTFLDVWINQTETTNTKKDTNLILSKKGIQFN